MLSMRQIGTSAVATLIAAGVIVTLWHPGPNTDPASKPQVHPSVSVSAGDTATVKVDWKPVPSSLTILYRIDAVHMQNDRTEGTYEDTRPYNPAYNKGEISASIWKGFGERPI